MFLTLMPLMDDKFAEHTTVREIEKANLSKRKLRSVTQ